MTGFEVRLMPAAFGVIAGILVGAIGGRWAIFWFALGVFFSGAVVFYLMPALRRWATRRAQREDTSARESSH